MRGAKSRLRIHKIGVYGDDWAYFQERRSAQPTTEHIRLSLQGKNPFANRGYEYEQHVAKMNARRQSLKAQRQHDPPQVERHTAGIEIKHIRQRPPEPRKTAQKTKHRMVGTQIKDLRQQAPTSPDVPQEANEVEDWYFRGLRPDDDNRVIQPGKNIYLRRLWGHDDAPSEVARKHHELPLRRVLQLEDKSQRDRQETIRTPASAAKDRSHDEKLSHEMPAPTEGREDVAIDGLRGTTTAEPESRASDGHHPGADQPQGAIDPRVGLYSGTEMPPRVEKAITRQYKLVSFEKKPLFSPRLSGFLEVPSPEAPNQAKLVDALQHSSELPVAAADIGPAESFQRSFTEDPVLMRANSLAGMLPSSMEVPSRLQMHSTPRFRLVPSWRSTPGKMPKGPQPSEVESKSLESHMSELQIKAETELQPEQLQERPHPGSISTKPDATDLEEGKATNDMELKTQDASASEDDGSGLIEPAQPPAPDNRSIFEKLFEKQERTKGTDFGQQYSKLKIAAKAAKGGELSAVNQLDEPEMAPQDGMNPRHGLSIFRQLFPEQAEPETAESEQESPRATHGPLHPPEDSVMVSLRNEVRNWMSEEGQHQSSWPKPGEYGSHSTVVVISGTSPSLMDTDFYRIAPEGQHMEGWAGGLVKVVQAHDSISYEPLGQYYLMFHTRPSALAYVNEVRRLHELSRKLLHAPADSGREVAKGPLGQAPASPQPFLTDEERAAVRSFTLCSPHVSPHISVRMWTTDLVSELAAKSSIADVLPTLRPEGSTPARVLLRLASPDGQHGEGQGGLTADELWLTLRDDGRERSAPWVLANLNEGIMPVKPKFVSENYKITVKAEPVPVSLELGDDDAGDADDGPVAASRPPPRKDGNGGAGVDRNERFRRFVLTFTQPAIARRFVRCWHKRVVYDALLDRSVVVDAVAIM